MHRNLFEDHCIAFGHSLAREILAIDQQDHGGHELLLACEFLARHRGLRRETIAPCGRQQVVTDLQLVHAIH